MRRTSRTLLGWCKSTRSCWMRTRVCPCTTRTAKNSWNSSEYSNRRDRAHPDTAKPRLNCPHRPLHTNTTLSHLQHTHRSTHTHTHFSCILLSCMLACRHVSTRSMLTRRPAPADQTTGAAPSGVHRRVCTPGLLVMKQLAETCVSGWQENNLRTFGVPAPCVCVSE